MPQRPNFDLYGALQVSKDASMDEIRVSYRRLALIHHPDKNPGDEAATERFQRINAAYEHLSEPTYRQAYDNTPTRPNMFTQNNYHGYYGSEDDEDEGFDFGYHYGFPGGNSHNFSSPEEYFFRMFGVDREASRRHAAQQAEFENLEARMFGASEAEFRRRAAAEAKAEQKRYEEFLAKQKQTQEEKRQREAEAEVARQAKICAKKMEEETKLRERQSKTILEKQSQERRWELLDATTDAEKKAVCMHSKFWLKEQLKRKLKCESCGKKSGLFAYKCPHCSLLVCQVCLQKLR